MVDPVIRDALLERLDALPPAQQRRVLHFAQTLHRPGGAESPDSLRRFAGTISTDDLATMRDAIEAGCETVDPGEW